MPRGRRTTRKNAKLYGDAEKIIVADRRWSFFFSVEFAALRDTVQNFQWIPDQIPRFADIWKSK